VKNPLLLFEAFELGFPRAEVFGFLPLRGCAARDLGLLPAETGRLRLERPDVFGSSFQLGSDFVEPLPLAVELAAPALEVRGMLRDCGGAVELRLEASPLAAKEPGRFPAGDLCDPGHDRRRVAETGLVTVDGAECNAKLLGERSLGQAGFSPRKFDATAEVEAVVGASDRVSPAGVLSPK
jgi:hypothetical protein